MLWHNADLASAKAFLRAEKRIGPGRQLVCFFFASIRVWLPPGTAAVGIVRLSQHADTSSHECIVCDVT